MADDVVVQVEQADVSLWWTLGCVAVAFALAITTMLDVLTTLIWYQAGGVDGNAITRRVIAVLGLDAWATLRCALIIPFALLVILVPHLLPARLSHRVRLAYVVGVCLLALALVVSQAQAVAYNVNVLGWLR